MKTGYFRMLFTLLAVLLLGSAAKAQTIHYVTPTGDNPATGNQWEVDGTVKSLSQALTDAVAGDQIWVLGFEQITDPSQLYVAPEGGFTVKSGVKLYGGFRGTERTIDERPTLGKAPYFTYRSVLSGDINCDDTVDEINYVYPANETREDNAKHVLSLNMIPDQASGNNNTYPTVVNGFTVIGGNAIGGNGGGIYVYGDNTGGGAYQIEKCFLLNNYAELGGGAIYVTSDVKAVSTESRIVDCVVYNNLAGVRSGSENLGGGINIAGSGTIVNSSIFNNEGGGVRLSSSAKAVNLTIARNTVMGIEGGVVSNSVIWGNSKVQNPTATSFENCASDNANVTGIDCISISSESNGSNGPLFEAPSVFTSFDRDFDWRRTAYPTWSWGILEGSALIDEGDDDAYTGLPSTDLAGETRKKGTIDIGAYEFQHLDASRIRYVKVGGTGDGSSWGNASGDLQKMIDELAAVDASGEVWVAAGEYRPTTQIIDGVQYAASFRMRDGINVYGGFAGTETSKADRLKGDMPWIYTNETILLGADYENGTATWANNQWNVTSSSRHVVWFAPMAGEEDFKYTTVLDGVTIKGGAANGGEGLADFATDKGGGVYMGLNATLQNSVITENTADDNGGGVFVNAGRVVSCLIYNNSATANGGGVFVSGAGLVNRSMVTENSAKNGSGVYLDKNSAEYPEEYLILSTSVISNNTALVNGAVYCNAGGVLLQNTIVNNDCPSSVDASNPNSSETGGLYINKYAYVINSVLWNNLINGSNVPMYTLGASVDNVRFYNNAISGTSNAVWNNIYQTSTLKLSDDNASAAAIGPDFMGGYPTGVGVQGSLDRPSYYWEPKQGSNLRAGGLTIGTFPSIVLVSPELDIAGIPFAQKPAMGAHGVKANKISASNYEVFVDINYTGTDANGASWTTPYKSLNEVLAYFAQQNLPKGQIVKVHVKEGDYWPRYAYTNLDPKTATLSIPALPNGAKFEIYGGYAAESDGTDLKNRFPTTYRTIIDGNHEGKNIDEGIYHCITVETGANVVLDGFHVINGYAAGTATLRYGAGMLVRDGATVEVRNSIFENNTAAEAAAIDARGATLTLTNCVVNNNTNTTETSSVVNANTLTLNHVSVVNNVGTAPSAMGTSSFDIGNSNENTFTFASVGADGAKNFANPTNQRGATLGFDTYYGGYSNFTPLTSSTDAGQLINKATGTPDGLNVDIIGNSRNLGGSADMGAYEANLPVNGTVFYVTATGAGKMDGSSWENAIAGNMIYDVTNKTNVNISTADSRYIGFYDASVRPYGETSGASKLFFEHLNEQNLNTSNVNYITEPHNGVTHVTGATGINIRNNRQEQYVGGLQYAVEQAAAAAAQDGKQRSVWVAGGTYTDYKGFVIRDKVNVLGGFPNEGTPGEDDRRPLISQYIPANEANAGLQKKKYETIIQIQSTAPVTWNGNTPKTVSGLPSRTRKPVLFQPDVCLPTQAPSGRESSFSYWEWGREWENWSNHWIDHGYGNSVPGIDENASNTYRWEKQEGGYVEYTGATWDGFTIRHGFLTDYKANRDGGAGVRMFRGVTLQNCVVTDNYINNHNQASRGAGIYCDGNNSKVVNCFVLHNATTSSESYGGGMYMILGTSYNTMVANNYAGTHGGGIYFADGGALFLNMVVWGNTASSDNNVSGPVYATFDDSKMEAASAANGNNFTAFFPFNYSFVERFELPSNMVNTSMTSDENLYFASSDRRLRAFSPLVNNGYSTTLQGYLATNWNIAASDMQGIVRIQDNINKIDVGAYAFLGGVIPEPKVGSYMAKLFVNQTTEFRVANTETLDLLVGRSFYTPLYHLDDALEYAKKAVDANPGAKIEIFVAQGTYKPTIRRMDAASGTVDQRQNSFVVPAGVNIYGGFSGKETYSYGLSSVSSEDGTSQSFTDITNSDISQYLTARETSDFNLNSINEPWELKNQTILSGDINASETVKNAYHVLYSDTEYGTGTVTLDGLTVMDGETSSTLTPMGNDNEVGRGGGLYSSGVDYIINRCRFLNNKGIRGNAAYVRNATTTVVGSTFAGSSTVETTEAADRIAGGAFCLAAADGETAALKAVNTLWANNETTGNGGAIGYAVNGAGSTSVNLMNNTIVRNKALNNGAIYAQGGTVTNTLVWGNEGNGNNMSGVNASYSAAEDLDATNGNNIKLAAENTSIEGPRFAQPSSAAGAAANDPSSKWNPSSINVLTDAGTGVLGKDSENSAMENATGTYREWTVANVPDYATQYMADAQYYRYAGPRDESGNPLDRTIDIGLYEYQYVTTFSDLDAVYVATTEAGNGSGDSWLNATSDLRGAIIAMANPTGGTTSDKAVYIRDGEYASKQLLTGTAFPLNMDKDNADGMNGTSLTIKGSYNEAGVQDFSNPTVISSYPGVATERLMNIATNNEPVFIEGILFNNATAGGDGIVSTGNNLKLARVAFRGNAGTGVSTSGNSLIYNALFADGGTGLNVGSGEVKVVNATFANNTTAINGTASVFNSVSWNSGNGVAEGNSNAVLGNAVNDDIQNGPNFVDPNNENILLRDYNIRPSMMLLNKGDNSLYESNVGVDPTTDVDLTNGVRVVDNTIDVGAYEYAAPLSQILYVKSNVVGSDESGSSWTNAIADLQGAIDLASIYANVNTGETGYVFVHNNVSANNVRVAMPGVKAYGSMNDETGTGVTDILGKRSSILDLQRRSTINGLTVAGTGSVVDGFEVSGTVAVSSGMLSTSIVKPTGAVTVTGDGVLYNSFVDGAVNGKAVNVTATGTITDNGGGNNHSNAVENGYVSADYWKYQLKDDSELIDKTGAIDIADYMTMAGHDKDISGSSRIRNTVDFGCFETWNITANTEITAADKPSRNHVVYVREGNELSIDGDALVYAGEATAFNPGFLLLESGSGLLANGKYVGLTNFAMERTIPAEGTALTYVPFLIDKMDNASNATFQRYDGATRATYDYKYSATKGAWVDVYPATAVGGVQAFAINGSAGAKVRFYGTSYKETPNDVKTVQLMKFNFNDPWTTNADGTINPDASNQFTHKENMSWNMFGSPYLHAMNYSDMEYGRVIYTGTSYETKNTADTNTSGSVAMGEGVFTQTATLQDYETFTVAAPTAGSDPQGLRGLLVTVAPADAEEADDFIQLKAVESEDASSEFNIAADGVKWMSDDASVAQIYMARNSGRYSMLSALDINGAVSLGLTIPEAAAYTIAIDEEAWMDEYETVVLEDKATGQMVDLLEGAYQFQAPEAGTVENRFSIRFNRIVDGLGDNVKAYSPSAGMIRVEGAAAGSLVRIYDLNGRCIRVGETPAGNYDVNVGPKGIYLVEVQQIEAEPIVKKVQVK